MKPKRISKKPSTSWGKVSHWYDSHLENEGTYHATVVLPGSLRLLGLKKGETLLDIACGQGFFSRAFAEAGAHVDGVDISPELIAIAKSKTSDPEAFRAANAENLSFIPQGTYDVATMMLAIQNIKDLDRALSEASRVLKLGGRFLIVMNHPAFRIPHASSWGHDEKGKVQYRRLDRYLSEATSFIDMNPGRKEGEKQVETVSYHRPLQVYVKALLKHGFHIEKLEEWISDKVSEPGPRQHAENAARKEFPLFLAVLCEKHRLS